MSGYHVGADGPARGVSFPLIPSRRTALRSSVGHSLLVASAILAGTGLTTKAHAQLTGGNIPGETGKSNGQVEQVTVTGSRLRVSNLTSAAPITVVTARQIEQSSSQTIEDVLRKIPSIGTEGNFSTTNNGGNGSSCIDIHNLGITRTLVLVDGKRFVHTPYGTGFDCVDLDTIPLQIVDRIEILKEGASAIYGADAVAGVVNIITKKDFNGAQVNAGGGVTNYEDGKQGDISGIFGRNFDHGRGNVTISGRFFDRQPVDQQSRPWSVPVASADNGPGQPFTFGSGIPVAGRYFGVNGTPGDATVINGQVQPFQNKYLGAGVNPNLPGRYDYGALSQLNGGQSSGNLAGNAHYDVNDHLQLYASAYYTHKNTVQQLSGQPVTANPNTGQSFDIPAGNPFSTALGFNDEVQAYRRVSDWGPRTSTSGADTWQATIGAKGNITGNWDYDTYFTYGTSTVTLQQTNQVNFTKLEQEMGFQAIPGGLIDDGVYNPTVCNPITGCVLANPYGVGGFNAQAIKYASFTYSDNAFYQFRDIGGSITNSRLLKLPYGNLGLSFGLEHRGEQGADHPDPIIESGQSTASAVQPTGGGFNVTELFGELRIPILANLPAAKDLSGDLAGRWSDYSTFGGVQNFSSSINWSPTRDIRFRATLGTSVRQPAISEAFGGQTQSFVQATDPCSVGNAANYGGRAGIVAANCRAQLGGAYGAYEAPGTQIPTLIGGNPNLDPETSRTYTIGTVITPRFIPRLTASVDYWHTKIANQIGSLTTQFIEDSCYTSTGLSSPFCAENGTRTAQGNLINATALESNLGVTKTSGIDFDLNYLVPLADNQSLSFSNELTDLVGYVEQQVPDGPFLNLKGRLSTINTGLYPAAYPVLRDTFTGTYNIGRFSFNYTMRYIDSMTYNDGSSDFSAATDRFYATNQVFYHDIEGTFTWKKYQVVAGIDNLLNKDPLFVLDTSTNTAPQVYDVLGRFYYLKFQARF